MMTRICGVNIFPWFQVFYRFLLYVSLLDLETDVLVWLMVETSLEFVLVTVDTPLEQQSGARAWKHREMQTCKNWHTV